MNELTTTPKSDKLTALVDNADYKNRIRELMGERAPQFISSMLTIGKALGDVEPRSLISACVTAATLNLPINQNLGFAWIVPYRDGRDGPKIAQFQLGYRGFVQLAMRTGQYRFINACVVYDGELGKYDKLTGALTLNQDGKTSEKVIGYASYFQTLNGFEHALYMTVDQVKAHAQKYSQSYRKGFGPWKDEFDAMGLKTVLKLNLSRWGILSIDMEKALFEDQAIRRDLHAEAFYPDGNDAIAGPVGLPAPTITQTEGGTPANGVANATPEKQKRGRKPRSSESGDAHPEQDGGQPRAEGPTSVLDQITAKLADAGFSADALVRVAILNNWAETTVKDLSEIEEPKLKMFLEDWDTTVAELEAHGKPPQDKPPFE